MTKLIPSRLAKAAYGLVMLAFGVLHFKSAHDAAMLKSLPSYLPGDGSVWIYVTGSAFMLAGLAIVINKYKRFACYGLAAMLLVFILLVHLEPAINEKSYYQPLKDIGLAMGAILIANNASNGQ